MSSPSKLQITRIPKTILSSSYFHIQEKVKNIGFCAIRSHNISDGKCVWAQTHT